MSFLSLNNKFVERNKIDFQNLLILLFIFVFVESFLNPVGEFPLNDDWSYTRSLLNWYETGQFRLTGFTSMPLVAQLLWGLTFCKIFGFSFTVLRFSTIVLSFLTIVVSYYFFNEFSKDKKISVFATLVLLFNPVFLNLSNTFMTDIPFLSFLMLSALLFLKHIKNENAGLLIISIIFISIATLIRQLGLVAAISYSFALIVNGNFKKKSFLQAFFSIIVPFGVYISYNYWLTNHSYYPIMYDEGVRQIENHLFNYEHSQVGYFLRQSFYIFSYLGLFSIPLFLLFNGKFKNRLKNILFIAVGFLPFVLFYFYTGLIMPFMGNIINPYGLGIVTLRDVLILNSDNLSKAPTWFWLFVTMFTAIGFGNFLFWIVETCKFKVSPLNSFLKINRDIISPLVFIGIYLILMLLGGVFDRYLLPLLPFIFALIIKSLGSVKVKRNDFIPATGVLIIFSLFSVLGCHDYLSWNRARWKALDYLMQVRQIIPERIDGGFEFNGFHLYDDTRLELSDDTNKHSWWWVREDDFLISFGQVKGYTEFGSFPYSTYLRSSGKIFILEKDK